MFNHKTSHLLIAISSLFLLVGCAKNNGDESKQPDANNFDQVLSIEEGKQWVMNSYNKMYQLDGVQINTDVPLFKYVDVYTKKTASADEPSVTNLDVNATFKQELNVIGLTRSEPNDIDVAYTANEVYCSLSKTGIAPLKGDTVSMNNGNAEMYVKDNKQYVNKSDPNVKEFFPYIMFGFMKDFKTIDEAKAEAEKVPDKFVDPTPVFKEENLPLNKKMTTLYGISFETIFNQLIKTNNSMEEKDKFLNFASDGKDMLMTISLGKYHISRIIFAINELLESGYTQQDIDKALELTLFIYDFDFQFIFSKDYLLKYTNFNVDFSFLRPDIVKNGDEITETKGTYNYVVTVETQSTFNFVDPYVRFPRDLKKYQEFDIKYPEINLNPIPTT